MSEEKKEEVAEEKELNSEEKNDKKEVEVEVKPSIEEELRQSLKEEKDRYLRLFAEFENYKKRTSKERMDLFRTANKEVIQELLPVLDDFERGIKNLKKIAEKEIVEGVEIIQNKLHDLLKQKGLTSIDIKPGDDFNTDYQEAITQTPAPSEELKGKVIDIVETGYELGGKVIRYAKVVIGK